MLVHVPGVTADKAPQGETFPFQDAFDKTPQPRPQHASPLLSSEALVEAVDLYATISEALVEAVDLYATISELAGLEVPDTCPDRPFHIAFCTEGSSLVPLIKNLTGQAAAGAAMSWKPAVFSQYPRPYVIPGSGVQASVMGYTMRTFQHRYTEWVAYDYAAYNPVWDTLYARELYVYSSDPDEDLNVAEVPAFQELARNLSRQLRAGWRNALPKPGTASLA